MEKAVKRWAQSLKIKPIKRKEIEGYDKDGRFVGDGEEICVRLLMGERMPGYGYYTGVWNIRKPDGSELYESIPEAKGMREAKII